MTRPFDLQRAGAVGTPSGAFGAGAQIVCDGLVKIYKVADLEVVALQGLDLTVDPAEFIAIVGASGSGKSTLLNILGGLDTPSAGNVAVAGHNLLTMGAAERTSYRRSTIGSIWQQTTRNLLPYLNALENVQMPMVFAGVQRSARRERAMHLLDLVGLGHRYNHRPQHLSGGEQQRVAIASALANEPKVLFADEPTGELDTTTATEVFDVLRMANEEEGVTVVVVTHDATVVDRVNRTVAIRDGRTSSELVRVTSVGHEGEHRVLAEEFAVLDRVGRLQLPTDYVEALELERRVKLTLDDDHINVWPDDQRRPPGDGQNGGTQ